MTGARHYGPRQIRVTSATSALKIPCESCGGEAVRVGRRHHYKANFECGCGWVGRVHVGPDPKAKGGNKGGRPVNGRMPAKAELIADLENGLTYVQIAAKYNVSRQTVANTVIRHGIQGISKVRRPASSTYAVRISDEFDPVLCEWLRKRIGKAFGGLGWHNHGTMHVVRGEYA